MEFIKGISFTDFTNCRGTYCNETSKEALRNAKDTLGLTHVTLCFLAYQDTAYSEEIDFNGPTTPTREDILAMVSYAKSIGLKVILKPMLDCKDGTWRAHINFFDIDVPCETKWPNWFANYRRYITTYAKIAEEASCEMLVIGTEMVQTERRTSDWCYLIQEVRKVYSGLITYNTDKYQEENVSWWNHVDVISASGYYPINDIADQMKRIEHVVRKYKKPYFFAEAGCPCREGSANNPNDWQFQGAYSEDEQARWWTAFFEQTIELPWLYGYTPWAWGSHVTYETLKDDGYDVYGKPAAAIIKENYAKR